MNAISIREVLLTLSHCLSLPIRTHLYGSSIFLQRGVSLHMIFIINLTVMQLPILYRNGQKAMVGRGRSEPFCVLMSPKRRVRAARWNATSKTCDSTRESSEDLHMALCTVVLYFCMHKKLSILRQKMLKHTLRSFLYFAWDDFHKTGFQRKG
jgi:hypothetical protein